jgi:hypothetical protein
MPLGSKLKVCQAIANEVGAKLDHESLHEVISLRNAFAHQPLSSHPVIVVKREPEPSEMHLQLQILTSAGKIVLKKRRDALVEFNAAFKSAKASLVSLLGAVKKQAAMDPA